MWTIKNLGPVTFLNHLKIIFIAADYVHDKLWQNTNYFITPV